MHYLRWTFSTATPELFASMFCGQQGFAGGFTFLRQACSIFLAKHSKKASSTFTSLVKKLPFVAGRSCRLDGSVRLREGRAGSPRGWPSDRRLPGLPHWAPPA
ncbi:unnamed protein product [Durusdinium trenchii]|uniref:Uncharacterized protein n=1 Tax=Durusdinium trenchii TaxID=1381693 RepID=A0ABP0L0A2_9DINO